MRPPENEQLHRSNDLKLVLSLIVAMSVGAHVFFRAPSAQGARPAGVVAKSSKPTGGPASPVR